MSAMYLKAAEAFAAAGINWVGHTIKAQLVDLAHYTVDLIAHQYLTDLPAQARIGAPVTLTGKTNVNGVCDAADAVVSGLSSAPSIEALVIYRDTGDEASSPLIVYVDDAAGLPVAAGATQVNLVWDQGPHRIFAL